MPKMPSAASKSVSAHLLSRVRLRRVVAGLGLVVLMGVAQTANIPVATDLGLLGASDAYAQKKPSRKPPTRRSETLSKQVFEKVTQAQEALAEDRHAEALAIYQRLLNGDLRPYERAVIQQQVGFVYADQGNYKAAIRTFEQAYAMNALNEQQQRDMQFYLGQLYLAEGQTDRAITYLESWLNAVGEGANPQAYFVLAQAYASKDNYNRALTYAERGIDKARVNKANNPEFVIRTTWYKFTIAMYFETRKYSKAKSLAREAIVNESTDKQLWTQLGAAYSLTNEEEIAYNVRQLMYVQGMLERSNDLELLAQLHLGNETPWRGVKVLRKGFSAGLVEKDAKNYELLAISLQESREWKDAIEPLTQAAKLSDDGDLYMRLCQSYLFDEKYGSAETNCTNAIRKGGLRDPGNTWMLLGTARYNRGRSTTALEAFKRAQDFDKTRRNATRWVRFIEQEQKLARLEKERRERKAAQDKARAEAEAAARANR